MFEDATQIRMELMNIKNKLEHYQENKQLTTQIKNIIENDNIHYYPLGGFTDTELILSRFYKTYSEFYCNDLFIGVYKGFRFRRSDIHHLHEFHDDGAIREDFTAGAKQYDSILYEFSFDHYFINGLLITTTPKSNDTGYLYHEDIPLLQNSYVYEELIPEYTTNKTLAAVGAASALVDLFILKRPLRAFSTSGRVSTDGSFYSDLQYLKNEQFNINQILTKEVITKINQLKDKYYDVELSIRKNNCYIKINDVTTFDSDKVQSNTITDSDIQTVKEDVEEMITLIQSLPKDAFTKDGVM